MLGFGNGHRTIRRWLPVSFSTRIATKPDFSPDPGSPRLEGTPGEPLYVDSIFRPSESLASPLAGELRDHPGSRGLQNQGGGVGRRIHAGVPGSAGRPDA